MEIVEEILEMFERRMNARPERENVSEWRTRLSALLKSVWENFLFILMNVVIFIGLMLLFTFTSRSSITTCCFLLMFAFIVDLLCRGFNVTAANRFISEDVRHVVAKAKEVFICLRDGTPLLCVEDTIGQTMYEWILLFTTFGSVFFLGLLFIEYSLLSICFVSFLIVFTSKLVVKFLKYQDVIEEHDLLPCIDDILLDANLERQAEESANNSLASGLGGMPSHLDEDYVQDDTIQEDDLLPSNRPSDSSDSDSSARRSRMVFDSIYRYSSESSEDENSYSKGLKFSDVADSKKVTEQVPVQPESSTSNHALLTNMLSNVLSGASSMQFPLVDNESDNDFEMITFEDVEDNERV